MQTATEPLTRQETVTEINRLFGSKNTNHGKLFCPSVEFYDQLNTNEGLLRAGKELCRWLGYKPHRLDIHFADSPEGTTDDTTITIPSYYVDFPYQAGALLALGVVRCLIASRLKHTTPDPAFVETASLERGLGILVLNGLHAKRSKLLVLHHLLHQNWHIREDVVLSSYRPADYGADLVRYAINYRVTGETWLPYISREALKLLPIKGMSHPRQHTLPAREQLHRQSARLWWAHVLLVSLLIGGVVAIFAYVLAQQPKRLPPAAASAYDTAQTLQDAYAACEGTARQQQNSIDVSDFYAQQRLNVTLARCASIRNQYNYQVDTYHQTLDSM